jgi:hypothetical protein
LRTGIIPDLEACVRLIRSREVLRLTGLSANQLREWTVRRALILPDVPAQKRGSEAKFSWRTVLLLRLAALLRNRFYVELHAHREVLASARELLDDASFPALWGMTLAIYDWHRCELLPSRTAPAADEDAVLLRLDRHLEVLSQRFGLPDPVSQLPLFPAVVVSGETQIRHSAKVGRP